jgi:hypothetical protein
MLQANVGEQHHNVHQLDSKVVDFLLYVVHQFEVKVNGGFHFVWIQ